MFKLDPVGSTVCSCVIIGQSWLQLVLSDYKAVIDVIRSVEVIDVLIYWKSGDLCDQIIVEVRLGSRVQLEQARASAEERLANFLPLLSLVEERKFLSILVEQQNSYPG